MQILTLLFLVAAGMIIFSALGTLIAGVCYGTDLSALTPHQQASYYRILQGFASVGTFILPALLFSYFADKKLFTYNQMDRVPNYMLTDIVIILSLALLPVVMCLAEWNDSLHLPAALQKVDNWMRTMDEKNEGIVKLMTVDYRVGILLVNILIMGALPAIGEELLFRGTIQPFLHKWIKNPHWAIWITAFIFSAIHFQISGFIPRFLLGAYLGYLFYWSGSLWLPILAHFMHNSLSLTADYIFLRRGYDVDNLSFSDISNYQYIFVIAVVFIIGGVFMLYRNRKSVE